MTNRQVTHVDEDLTSVKVLEIKRLLNENNELTFQGITNIPIVIYAGSRILSLIIWHIRLNF